MFRIGQLNLGSSDLNLINVRVATGNIANGVDRPFAPAPKKTDRSELKFLVLSLGFWAGSNDKSVKGQQCLGSPDPGDRQARATTLCKGLSQNGGIPEVTFYGWCKSMPA